MRHNCLFSGAHSLTFAAFIFFLGLGGNVSGQTNSWASNGDGFWDDPLNWSLGLAPSTNHSLISIDSAGSKTVTIDRFTSANNAGTLTVSNLSISAPSGSTNTLFLNNAGTNVPLQVLNTLTVGTNGAVIVSKSALKVKNGVLKLDGALTENSGEVSAEGGIRLGNSAGASGFYNLAGGVLTSGFSEVGDLGIGTFSQSGGSNVTGSLTLGRSNSSFGSYTLTGGWLSTSNTAVGLAGSGVFAQSGGIHVAKTLIVAPNTGAYYLTNGLLSAGSIQSGTFFQYGGLVTSATDLVSVQYTQSGGTNTTSLLSVDGASEGRYTLTDGILITGETDVGFLRKGSFTQFSGFHFTTNLSIGKRAGNVGRYTLLGGSLIAGSLAVGESGLGTFSQSAGITSISNNLRLGVSYDPYYLSTGGQGTYNLRGGILAAGNVNIGGGGVGIFNQSDGTNLVSGSLSVVGGNSGLGTNSYNLSGGFLSASNETVEILDSSLINQTGGTNQVTGNLIIGGRSTRGSSILYNLSGGYLSVSNLNLGFSFRPSSLTGFNQSGGVNLVAGTITVGRANAPAIYILSGGSLRSAFATIGDRGAGTFNQSGGTNSIQNILYLGLNSGGNGVYNLTDGTLLVQSVVIGSNSVGTFNQYGSQVFFSNDVVLAAGPGSSGTYNLSSGITATPKLTIGQGGSGSYVQSGGTNVIGGNLLLGVSVGSTGTFNLNNGIITAPQLTVGQSGSGKYSQSGGTNTVEGALSLGVNAGSTGTYNLNNGFLSAESASIGVSGWGTFNQQGGRMVITNDFAMGSLSSFTLQNGSASVGTMEIASNAVVTLGPGARLDGGGIQNDGLIQGMGSVSNSIDNRGTISANSGGVLSLFGPVNSSGSNSTFATYPTATLFVGNGLTENRGTIFLNGGTFDNNHHTLVNKGLIVGNGLFRSSGLRNSSRVFLKGRTIASFVYGTVTNDADGTIEVSSNSASFFGNVVNNGTFINHNGAANFKGNYTENGTFFSELAFSFFNDLNVSATGAIIAPGYNQVYVAGNFYNASAQASLWDTASVRLVFDGGSRHLLQLPGEDRGTGPGAFASNFMWSSLRLAPGQSLTLQDGNAPKGSALYVGTLTLDDGTNQIASITGNGLDIYYDANAPGNAYLGNGTFSLSGGGLIEPAVIAPRISVVSNYGLVFVLQFDFVPGKSYGIEYSNDLLTWTAILNPSLTSPASGVYEWRDDGSLTGGLGLKRFYRIKVQ